MVDYVLVYPFFEHLQNSGLRFEYIIIRGDIIILPLLGFPICIVALENVNQVRINVCNEGFFKKWRDNSNNVFLYV